MAGTLAARRRRPHTVAVLGAAVIATRALLFSAVLSSLLTALLVTLPVDGPGSVGALGAALALALAAGLLSPARRMALLATGSTRSPDAPRPDERCRRGVFRRQTSPDAPGRVRPRAPQTA
jgi:hypothetical protein